MREKEGLWSHKLLIGLKNTKLIVGVRLLVCDVNVPPLAVGINLWHERLVSDAETPQPGSPREVVNQDILPPQCLKMSVIF